MRNVIFLGPPGCGKGTQSKILSKKLDFLELSTGHLFRNIAKQKSELGIKIQDVLSSGNLVGDDLVDQLVDDFYKNNSSAKGFILDGYPRNINQAYSLEKILNKYNAKIDKVFYFNLDEDLVVKRILGRYTCGNCGSIYNSFFNNTKLKNICDQCGSEKFNKRSDDSEKIVIERLKVYRNNTKPLLDYYEDKLVSLDAANSKENVFEQLLKVCINYY